MNRWQSLDPRRISQAELVSALSYALDLTEGQPEGHSVRACWIGTSIGRRIGLSQAELGDLYYALLLKDIGCSSNAARICELFLTDDIDFKHDVKIVNDSLPQVLRFVLSHTGLKAGLAERFRAILTALANGDRISRELIETRCQRGAEIVRQMRFPEPVAQGILDLDEHWNGKGQPLGLAGEQISIFARIALLSQVADVFHTSAGAGSAIREVTRRAGSWLDPALVKAFQEVAAEEAFWSTLRSKDLSQKIIAIAPPHCTEFVDDDYLDAVASAFAKVVDSKSPFTSGHSDRVALYTDLIAEALGLSGEQRRYLKRIALLHDIGKLAVSNQVLDKPGKLDDEEWAAIRLHPVYSETILTRIGAFKDLARVAGAHHERLDGKGYPKGLRDDQICMNTRIITTADIFDALTADRPYRKAMPTPTALGIMRKDVGTAIDPVCLDALERAIEGLHRAVA